MPAFTMTIKVYANDLLGLTMDAVGDEDFFELKDPENETEEHLVHLRLRRRLSHFTGRRRPTVSSCGSRV